ncbi:RDD family protein [Janibacter sp. FSL W8-0316]|uniref:RDD family protein n=1 Tax=Janibacter sp. FSL W8-0316 TaxID=2975325 RepID=UPI0030F89D7A
MSSSTGRPAPTPDEGGDRAPLGRRLVAIVVDWVACLLITHGLIGRVVELSPEAFSFAPLALLFLLNLAGATLGGATFGHRLLGLRVVPMVGEWVTPLRAAVRAALLCLAIPAMIVISDDGRGLHDRAAGTRIVRASR